MLSQPLGSQFTWYTLKQNYTRHNHCLSILSILNRKCPTLKTKWLWKWNKTAMSSSSVLAEHPNTWTELQHLKWSLALRRQAWRTRLHQACWSTHLLPLHCGCITFLVLFCLYCKVSCCTVLQHYMIGNVPVHDTCCTITLDWFCFQSAG